MYDVKFVQAFYARRSRICISVCLHLPGYQCGEYADHFNSVYVLVQT